MSKDSLQQITSLSESDRAQILMDNGWRWYEKINLWKKASGGRIFQICPNVAALLPFADLKYSAEKPWLVWPR